MSTLKAMSVAAEAEVSKLFKMAEKCASEHVIAMARQILKDNPEIHEFCMAMGSACFLTFDGRSVYDDQIDGNDPRVRPLHAFIDRWDNYLRVSGEPMRFTRDSKIVRDWKRESHATMFGRSKEDEALFRGLVLDEDGRYVKGAEG